MTWEAIAEIVGCNPVFLCSVVLGQNLMEKGKGVKFCEVLGLGPEVERHITEVHPTKSQANWDVLKQDPVLYRLHEANLVYGTAIKEMIHEKFGDGIMSAIDFEVYVDKVEDSKGDRVKITLNGKFLPYRKW